MRERLKYIAQLGIASFIIMSLYSIIFNNSIHIKIYLILLIFSILQYALMHIVSKKIEVDEYNNAKKKHK